MMSFSDTYRHEVYMSRKDRARKAFFWAKVVSFLLVITIGATLRVAPELRSALMDAGMNTVVSFANLNSPQVSASTLPPAPNGVTAIQTEPAQLPTSRIKVNRFGGSGAADANTAAQELGHGLSGMKPAG